jgi:alpha-tubulin suppressor-like RCC1 family protein
MFGIKVLVEKLDALIASGSLSDLDLARAMGAIESIEKNGLNVVASLGDLPAASNNKGRFFFVTSEQQYVLSNGTTWSIDNVIKGRITGVTYAWGNNQRGKLGDQSETQRTSPVTVVGGYTDWINVSGGGFHSLGVRDDGTIWAWGNNDSGQLGNNATTPRSSPLIVVGGITDWIQVSAGYRHSLGLRADGTAWSWGYNNRSNLGDGTTIAKSSPVSVVGGYTDWAQVSAGGQHSLGLRVNGTAWGWGEGGNGKLGDNTTVNKSSPVSVVGGFTDWIQLNGGTSHSLGVRANGTAWAWGSNQFGQLGDGTTISKSSPVSVLGGFTDWIQVSAGYQHSLGVRANGTALAWGNNQFGRLGDGTTLVRSIPVTVVGGFTDWIQTSAGQRFGIGLRGNGSVWGWGINDNGQLGDNTLTSRLSPVSVVGGLTDWVQIEAGDVHSLGIVAGKWSE